MIKDILVHVPTEHPQQPVIDASVSLATSFGAHLDALAIGYISKATSYAPPEPDAASAVAAFFEAERETATERAATALATFETEARNAGIAYASHPTADFAANAAVSIGAAARLYDLAIVDNAVSREILFQAGGPVLFIPHVFRGAFKAKRIGICWDGSRLAARALRDARPFLAQADTLLAITIKSADTPAEASADKLAKHLALVGLTVRIIELPAARAEIQPFILSVAADQNLDMLVMGAYGHSLLHEGLLGSVTRAMLRTMTVPTLMSH
jgi:nucleotide-binding universal stress UspA family protein